MRNTWLDVGEWRRRLPRILDHNGNLDYDYGQCVDVLNNWAVHNGIPEAWGNAIDLDYSSSCDFIDNAPTNVPVAGDMVIWNGFPADARYGHCAVALHGCNMYKLRAESQDFPYGSDLGPVIFTYEGVKGWWHRRPH